MEYKHQSPKLSFFLHKKRRHFHQEKRSQNEQTNKKGKRNLDKDV